ncbi:MAG: acetyl-CoA C-acyltransferase [Epsilonproteobacteria bacterium]|nr:MAG: acetyl-CoA C-acyltransferase [Campylobacterota bacterium]RLA66033.1 MAG: acetyl-CoA C-acyltransferase [Campylobacterota bacterium]
MNWGVLPLLWATFNTRRKSAMREVYLIDGKRAPQAKSGLDLKDVPVPYLGSNLIRNIMDETIIPNDVIDEVIFGNTGAPPKYPNIGRVIALEAGLNKKTSGVTVHRNCASGMEAMGQGWLNIASGRSELVFAGGVESMSQMPLIYGRQMTELFIKLMKARTVSEKLKALSSFRIPYLSPVVAIEVGLTDPFCGLNMGQTAEVLAREFGITREQQDEFANRSHMRAVSAQTEGRFDDEIVPVKVGKKLDRMLDQDIGPRSNSSVEGLAKMKPYFEKKSGTVTIGNSCPITDGGSVFLMASEEAVKKYNLTPMARMIDYHFAGLEPERMGMGPLRAMDGVLKKTNLNLDQMDLIEINEAFAAQIIAVRMAAKDKSLAAKFDVNRALGEIHDEKFNVNGGGIALGHPVGSSGSRIVVTLAHELKRRKAKYGVASLCIGGGQGGAVVIENLEK